jgi:hypothetical protein
LVWAVSVVIGAVVHLPLELRSTGAELAGRTKASTIASTNDPMDPCSIRCCDPWLSRRPTSPCGSAA